LRSLISTEFNLYAAEKSGDLANGCYGSFFLGG
jgi:hypothetical protein